MSLFLFLALSFVPTADAASCSDNPNQRKCKPPGLTKFETIPAVYGSLGTGNIIPDDLTELFFDKDGDIFARLCDEPSGMCLVPTSIGMNAADPYLTHSVAIDFDMDGETDLLFVDETTDEMSVISGVFTSSATVTDTYVGYAEAVVDEPAGKLRFFKDNGYQIAALYL